MSDDQKRAISIIAFIGSVFSPWYRWSGRKDPENHVCINVATYGPGGRFTMTDRGRTALKLTSNTMTVGPSQMHWKAGSLIIDIDEMGAPPMIAPVRGQVRLS
ncbi:MAG: carotenoid 1,2-hydratase, partial [Pseudomonadota bacterium]|nr:carotenoid 1,2-hydratase [Pseudomonadota bacterium]